MAENVLGEPADIPDEVSDGETADSTTDYIPPQHLGLQTDPLSERKVSTWKCSPTTIPRNVPVSIFLIFLYFPIGSHCLL